jgi:hypothetical protein
LQPFNAFVDALTRPLSSIGLTDQENPASELQRQVSSIHLYPNLTVIEKAAWSPLAFELEYRGSDSPEGWLATHAAPRQPHRKGTQSNTPTNEQQLEWSQKRNVGPRARNA